MNGMDSKNILLLTDPRSDPPPNTDMIYSESAILRSNLLDTFRLGVAVAFGFGIIFLVTSLVVQFGTGLSFLEKFCPGFELGTCAGMLVGFLLSFLYGFIFGLVLGLVYNCLVRLRVIQGENLETYA